MPSDTSAPAKRFQAALEAIPRARPADPLHPWTDADAAHFWVDDYDPQAPNSLPPPLILGVVARLLWPVLVRYPLTRTLALAFRRVDTPGMHRDPQAIWGEARMPPPGASEWRSVIRSLSAGLFVGCKPQPATTLETAEAFSAYGSTRPVNGYCHGPTCTRQRSWMNGCIPRTTFERLLSHHLVVPWESVSWPGLACLVPPLRYATDTPHMVIREPEAHHCLPYVPLTVADLLRQMNSVLPPILMDYRRSASFVLALTNHLDALLGERLRYWGTIASGQRSRFLMERWDYNFATACWSFGRRDAVYAEINYGAYWGVSDDVHERLCENQSADLFPDPRSPR